MTARGPRRDNGRLDAIDGLCAVLVAALLAEAIGARV